MQQKVNILTLKLIPIPCFIAKETYGTTSLKRQRNYRCKRWGAIQNIPDYSNNDYARYSTGALLKNVDLLLLCVFIHNDAAPNILN